MCALNKNSVFYKPASYRFAASGHKPSESNDLENVNGSYPDRSTTQREISRRVGLAKEYLCHHHNSNVNLKELASHSCLSVTHLLRTFKLTYRITPHQFLIQLRLQNARFLLKHSAYPVKEIVRLVGFDSTSSFIKLFRERYQVTPLHYRNN